MGVLPQVPDVIFDHDGLSGSVAPGWSESVCEAVFAGRRGALDSEDWIQAKFSAIIGSVRSVYARVSTKRPGRLRVIGFEPPGRQLFSRTPHLLMVIDASCRGSGLDVIGERGIVADGGRSSMSLRCVPVSFRIII
ncbi:hypothetical protein [Streptomyces sp. NPDC088554]|uniref:hypothetical protein n=1 Tax=Streptomyces sp. NPDC088554 TaxID=3365865 RepID=UPI00381A76AD